MALPGTVLLVAVALGWLGPLPAESAPSAHEPARDADNDPASIRQQTLLRLQEALGLPAPTFGGENRTARSGRREEAPEFMLELQRRVAYPDGTLRQPVSKGSILPHGARIVRSFFEQGPMEDHLLRFTVSGLSNMERVLAAELRVYRLRRTRVPLLLRVYQVEEGRSAHAAPDEHRLLGVQATPARAAPGWHSFNVLPAARAWLAGDAPNLGLLVTASTLDGSPAHAPAFARRARHGSRQPLLVLYNADLSLRPGRIDAPAIPENEVDNADEGDYDDEDDADEYDNPNAESEEDQSPVSSVQGRQDAQRRDRQRRDASWSETPRRRRRRHFGESQNITAVAPNATKNMCSRYDLWVEFQDLGWDAWIISPSGFNAFQCVGTCPYPIAPALYPSNHATVQSIVHALGRNKNARPPCCTPDELNQLSLLYKTDDNEPVLKIYEDMMVRNCGCK